MSRLDKLLVISYDDKSISNLFPDNLCYIRFF